MNNWWPTGLGTTADDWALLVTFMTALAAAITSFTSLIGVRNNRILIEATLWPDFNRRYKNEEMGQALRELAYWYFDHPSDFVDLWLDELKRGEARAKQLDAHRRLVSMFFIDIASLYRDEIISQRFAKFLANQAGLNIFYSVVVPMNMAHRPERTKEAVRYLRKLHTQVEGGMVDLRKVGQRK